MAKRSRSSFAEELIYQGRQAFFKLDASCPRAVTRLSCHGGVTGIFLPEGSHALCHPRRIQDRSNDARLQAGDAAPMAASPLTPISMPKIRRPAAPGFRVFMMSVFFSRRPKSSQVVPRNLGWPDHFRDQKVAKNLPYLGLWHKCGGASRTLPRVRVRTRGPRSRQSP